MRPLRAMVVNLTPSKSLSISWAVLIAACLLACGCARPDQAKEQEPTPSQPAQSPPPPQISTLPPPALNEVQAAVQRVFKDAAVVDTTRSPNFIPGDFNGDLSEDIVVVLKPAAGKLSEMNQDFPPWILKDPFLTAKPGMPPLRVVENELLLTVIHGYGPNGWRDKEATQTFLLKNAVGSAIETHPKREFVSTNQGRKLPRLSGDLIGEVLRGKSGYLYYAEATYSWYDPKTFKGEPERRLVHSGVIPKTK